MKLALFNDWRLGVVTGEEIADITALVPQWSPSWPYAWMLTFIANFDAMRKDIERFVPSAPRYLLEAVELKPPIPQPSKVIAAPVNYPLHQAEMGGVQGVYHGASIKTIEHYGLFLKPPSSIVGPNSMITLPFKGRRTDHEAEVAVVIGKTVKNVVESEAEQAIFGMTGLLDLSVRGQEDRPFRKGFDGFCPLGPVIVTRDEVKDWDNIEFRLTVNGTVRQQGNTGRMIYPIRRLVALASYQTTLYPGDVIATGTPEGVGEILPGDVLTLEVDGVGRLTVSVSRQYAEPPEGMGSWFDPFLVARGAPV
ncbi:MAG: fumarylacetoacetate hydrolase family protein [Firmicutes bacterium]|nr:fumarylacetoacetate hydrolase family protein [Bacillota bacterium]